MVMFMKWILSCWCYGAIGAYDNRDVERLWQIGKFWPLSFSRLPFLPHLGESGHLGELQHDDHHHHCHHRRDYNDDDDDDRDNDQTSLKIKFHDCLPSPTLESSNMMMTKMVTKMATTLGYNNTITDGGSTAPLYCWYHTEEKSI